MDAPEWAAGRSGVCRFCLHRVFRRGELRFFHVPGLTHGAATLIYHYGTEEQKRKYMDRMFSGEWTGTMCSPNRRGFRRRRVKTTARRLPDGKYLITGTKCFTPRATMI